MACIASKLCDNGSISSGVTLRRFYMFRLKALAIVSYAEL